MLRRNIAFLIMLSLVISFSINLQGIVALGSPQAMPVSETVPFDSYHIIPLNRILYPRLASPHFAIWGESKTIYVYPQAEDESLGNWRVSIVNKITGNVYDLEVLGTRWITDQREEMMMKRYLAIDVVVPQGIERGLYNLVVQGANTYEEPNSFYIYGQAYPDSVLVAHISDNHLGPKGKPKYMKENKFFARALATIEAMGIDLIVSTGDFIDGSRDENVHRYVYDWLSTLSTPFVVCTGNTDYSVMEGGKWFWEKYLAPNSAAIRLNNILILSINARNGDLPSGTIMWIEDVLQENIDANIKIYMQHYPSYDPNSTSKKVMDKLAEWAQDYGLNLALHGHLHTDVVKHPPETPMTTIVSTSTATSGLYRGFRLISLLADGAVSIESSRNLFETYVEYLQPNDYTATGQTAIVSRLPDVTLIVKLKDIGHEAIVEGAKKVAEHVSDGKRTVYIGGVFPGENSIIKVYQEPDDSPPEVKVSVTATENEIEIRPIATDEGLGVTDIKVYYSPDNETWTEFTPKVEDGVKFFVMKTPLYDVFYYKIVVTDAAGLESVYYGSKELGLGPGGGEVGGQGIPNLYLAIIVVLLVISLSYLIWRLRR